jgi:CRISPR-associated protein Cmr4
MTDDIRNGREICRVTSKEYLLFLYAESPIHAGAADSEGLLDLPIQREASTCYPVIWGQSLKGALRQAAVDAGWGNRVTDVFGPTVEDRPGAGLDAGSLVVGDAQLVAMPVATLTRTFAWITTRLALARLSRKYQRLNDAAIEIPSCRDDAAVAGQPWTEKPDVVLGPCVTGVEKAAESLTLWAEKIAQDSIGTEQGLEPFSKKLCSDLILVGDSVAGSLLKECTEMSVRVQLNASKTVAHGPFHTEYLPSETILAASLTLRPHQGKDDVSTCLEELLSGTLHQVGGDETIGKGLVWCHLVKPVPSTDGDQ